MYQVLCMYTNKIITKIVTVRAKTSLVHTSDFTKLIIHKNVLSVSNRAETLAMMQ